VCAAMADVRSVENEANARRAAVVN